MAEKKGLERVAEGVYRRPSGKYVVPIFDPVSGKRRWAGPGIPKGGFDNLKDAKAFKRKAEAEKADRATRVETCDSFAKRWPRDYVANRGESTTSHYTQRLKVFIHDFKGVPLGQVPRAMARLWINGGAAPASVRDVAKGWKGAKVVDGEVMVPDHKGHHSTVRAMFNDAIDDELVQRNPFAALGVEQARGRSDIILITEDELDALVDTAVEVWGDFGREMFGPMISTAAGTGMRPGELYALRWDWIDLEAEEIHVKRQFVSKTGKEDLPGRQVRRQRTVALLPFVRAALAVIPKQEGDDHVFHIPRGGTFSQRALHYYWDPVRKAFWGQLSRERRNDIPIDFDFYELRHYAGTYLANLGVSPYDISDMLGHADGGALAMARYIHTRSEDSRDRIKRAVREAQAPGKKRQTG